MTTYRAEKCIYNYSPCSLTSWWIYNQNTPPPTVTEIYQSTHLDISPQPRPLYSDADNSLSLINIPRRWQQLVSDHIDPSRLTDWLSSESQNTSVAVADMFAKDAVVDIFAKHHNSFLLQQHCIGLESVIKNKKILFYMGGGGGGGCPIICADLRGTALCRSSRHPYLRPHPRLIPHHGPAPKGPHEETSDRWWAACPKETLHCCRVTSVVFRSACSDWTYTGHHLLCPLLTTVLAKSRSQTEWASPTESRPPLRPSNNPSMWTLWRWGLWSELP